MKQLVRSFAENCTMDFSPYRAYIHGWYLALTSAAIFLGILAIIDTMFDKVDYPFANPAMFMVTASAFGAFVINGFWKFFWLFVYASIAAFAACVVFIIVDSYPTVASTTDVVITILGAWLFGILGVVFAYVFHAVAWLLGAAFRWTINWSYTNPPDPTMREVLHGRA